MAKEHAAALKAMALCGTLADAEIEAIAAIAEMQDVAAGKDLFREGDAGDGLYLVLEGEIDVVKRGPHGDRSLARLGAGAILGEISLLTNEVRSATGRALVGSRVLRLPAQRFRALLDAAAPATLKIVAAIAEVLAHRLVEMNNKVIEIADNADARGKTAPGLDDKKLAELHRTMQIWSF